MRLVVTAVAGARAIRIRRWRIVGFGQAGVVVLAVMGVVLAGCGGSDGEETGPQPSPRTPDREMGCWVYAPALVAHEVLSAEDLANVHEDDAEEVETLIYPEGHPRVGEIMPFDEWEEEQHAGWVKYLTARGNLGPMLKAAYDSMIEEVSPTEFRSRAHEDAEESVQDLFYPTGHPQAGEFIPSSDWGNMQGLAWEHYLSSRPKDAPCP